MDCGSSLIIRFSAIDNMLKPPLPLSSPKNSDCTDQFLDGAHSDEDSITLPYMEEDIRLINQHLLDLSDAYPSFHLRITNFTHNSGHSVNLFQAECTLPTTLDISIIIWLMECYPHFPPLVFVKRGSDTIINRQNPCLSPDGSVSILYLKNWTYRESNLVELARNLSQSFEFQPPFYYDFGCINDKDLMIPRISGAIVPAGKVNHTSVVVGGDDNDNGDYSSSISSRITCTNTDCCVGNEMEILAEKLHRDLVELRKKAEGEMNALFSAQGILGLREKELGKLFAEMLDEKETLEHELQLILLNNEVLDGWLKEKEEEKLGNLDLKSSSPSPEKEEKEEEVKDIDEALEPCDRLSKQILNCSATDLAIEDTMYAMDEALQEESIPLNQYLKYIRSLSREQFYHRATASKVRDVQMQVVQVFKSIDCVRVEGIESSSSS